MFVYLVTNTVNGKRYVGQTTKTLEERWRLHQKVKTGHLLYSAIQKYGVENFTIEPICELPTVELLDEFEKEYIRRYCTLVPNGYNLTEGGNTPRMSDETRKKMSLSHIGKSHTHKSGWGDERRKVASLRMLGNQRLLGFRHSNETKYQIAKTMKVVRREDPWSTKSTT